MEFHLVALVYTPETEKSFSCPGFSLPGVDGQDHALENFNDSKALVVLFLCNHCPYVQAIEDRILNLAKEFSPEQCQVVAICSNDANDYPEDSFENIQKQWKKKDYGFPYLYDESQDIAKSFDAVCTPDIFLFGQDRKLFYRGRFDDSWKDPTKVTKQELKLAIEDVLADRPLSFEPTPSMGCSIKWKG